MDIADIRRENLRQLIKTEFKTRAEFADKINKSPSQVAMWFMSSKGKRAIGEKVARDIEKRLGLNQGELDLETGKEPGQGLSYNGKFKNLIQAEADDKLDATEKSILEALDLKHKSKKRKGC